MTTPEPRPRSDYQLLVKQNAEARAVPHQRAHVGDARPLGHFCALRTRRDTLAVRCGLSRQTTLVDLEVDGSKEAHVRRDTVAGGEGDEIARDEFIREEVYLRSIADDVTVVRDELVERLKRLFGTSFLYEADLNTGELNRLYCVAGEGEGGIPVRTMMMAMVMLTASSTFPMIALTTALPQRRRMSGLS